MQYKKMRMFYAIKIENGEEIIKSLTNFCGDKKIKGGWFFGLGGAKKIRSRLLFTKQKEIPIFDFQKPSL